MNQSHGLFSLFIAGLFLLPLQVVRAENATEEIKQLREQTTQQQQTIQRLEETQKQQAKELESLNSRITNDEKANPASGDSTKQAINITPESMEISVGAHVNRAINVVDDGARSDTYFVDNGNYPTLFYLKGVKQVSDDLNILGHIEYALQSNAATAVSQDNQEAGFAVSARFFEISTDSKRYGKLTLGRGFMSSFIATELDKSETWYYNLISPGNSFGGMKFVKSADNSLTDLTVNEIYLDVEAFSFRDRIRYDSPVWGGAQLSGSAGSGNSGDVTFRWNKQLKDYSIFVGASAQNNPFVGRIDERFDGGVAVYHQPTGLNLTVAGVKQKFTKEFYESYGRTDGKSDAWVVRAGLRRNWFKLGETRMAIDITNGKDVLYADDEGQSYGAFFGQMINDWNAELYTGYRIYDYDAGPNSGGLSVHAIHGFTVGARILFDATFKK